MIITQLNQLASIHFGIPRQPTDESEHTVAFIQPGDVDEFGRLRLGMPRSNIGIDYVENDRALVNPGDVLLSSKGTRNVAVFYHPVYPKAVASNSFYILRLYEPSRLLPEFLACFFNLPATQKQLQNRVGLATTVPTLNKKDLLDFPIPVPPLVTQERLIHLHRSFLDIYDNSRHQLNLQQELLYQCFSITLLPHL